MSKEKNDLTLKVFALIIAFILWSYVMSEVNPDMPENFKNVSVAFTNLSALERQGLMLMEPEEATITVRVNGRKTEMAKLMQNASKYIKASVDLSGYVEGQVKVPVNVFLEDFPDLRIERYEPSEILFTFDKLIDRDKSITIKAIGSLDSNYIQGAITTKSQTVMLKGPRSWVNEVAEVVAVVDLTGRKESGYLTVPIKLLDDEGNDVRGVEYEPKVIDLVVPVYKTATIPIELRTENHLPDNYEIADVVIYPSQIALKGDNGISNLSSVQTKSIDINTLIENPSMEVELDLPPNVSLVNPNERVTIYVNIEETATDTFEYTLEEINIKNLEQELSIDREDLLKTVKLVVKGNREVMDELTKEDLEPYIDLNLFGEGEYWVTPSFNIPEGIVVKEVNPQIINIKLNKR
ncbi:MAG: CdaR family protein [Tissierellaceae bacterium]|nr:CdaR family protein [Tissierellaceae bacterium]